MKLLVDLIKTDYPDDGIKDKTYKPRVWDFQRTNVLMGWMTTFNNGTIVEMRVSGGSKDAINFVRQTADVSGCPAPVELDDEEISNLKLYHAGDECYKQRTGGYIFLNPVPQPDLADAS